MKYGLFLLILSIGFHSIHSPYIWMSVNSFAHPFVPIVCLSWWFVNLLWADNMMNYRVSAGKSASFPQHSVSTWYVQVKYWMSCWHKWLANHMAASQHTFALDMKKTFWNFKMSMKMWMKLDGCDNERNVVHGAKTSSHGLRFHIAVKISIVALLLRQMSCLCQRSLVKLVEDNRKLAKITTGYSQVWKLTTCKTLKNYTHMLTGESLCGCF